MIRIVHSRRQKTARGRYSHSYLIDIGSPIEIHQAQAGRDPSAPTVILDPPYPKTRYFEIELGERKRNGGSITEFLNIYPVYAEKKPDWRIFRFVLRQGSWRITERLCCDSGDDFIQWIYNDDFNLLYLTQGMTPPELMVDCVIAQIRSIVSSIRSGRRLQSHMENQIWYRHAVEAMRSARSPDPASRPADFVTAAPERAHAWCPPVTVTASPVPEDWQVVLDLDRIEELNDISWLCE